MTAALLLAQMFCNTMVNSLQISMHPNCRVMLYWPAAPTADFVVVLQQPCRHTVHPLLIQQRL